MTKRTRRRYTVEFKAAAVARLDETGETLSSVGSTSPLYWTLLIAYSRLFS
jgi:hypothetical protein